MTIFVMFKSFTKMYDLNDVSTGQVTVTCECSVIRDLAEALSGICGYMCDMNGDDMFPEIEDDEVIAIYKASYINYINPTGIIDFARKHPDFGFGFRADTLVFKPGSKPQDIRESFNHIKVYVRDTKGVWESTFMDSDSMDYISSKYPKV